MRKSALKKLFLYPAKPCSFLKIWYIEARLGKRLPAGYRRLIRATGGGELRRAYSFVPGGFAPHTSEDGVVLYRILGNGETTNGEENYLHREAPELIEDWELPKGVLPFAESETDVDCFVINYRLPDFPRRSILHLDPEVGTEPVKVADSFDDFLAMLTADPDWDGQDELDELRERSENVVRAVREGPLAPDLRAAIDASGIPDAERLIRVATEKMIDPPAFSISFSESACIFIDILFMLASGVRPIVDLEDFTNFESHNRSPTMVSMVHGSFVTADQEDSLSLMSGPFDYWWRVRTEQGALIQVDGGYRLDVAYLQSVINDLRALY
ncbi:SMI1/KNR4 family protein [Corynebacterium sp. AOP40-9SA-29]|uniref:SMI1/KNR4 family protein n=1 Tax=Corynebacterium sp. AOP40-9SA-29 TaxID=3457677 RepID=UPI00403463B2